MWKVGGEVKGGRKGGREKFGRFLNAEEGGTEERLTFNERDRKVLRAHRGLS